MGQTYAFKHNNIADCEKQLQRAVKMTEKTGGGILLITEGVFGMDGEQGILKEIVALKKDYPDLYKIGKEIEVCYSVDEDSAKVKCRLFIDILSLKIFNSYSNINPNNTYESLDEKIRLLKNILPANFIKEINAFDEIRIAGNNAAHPQQKYRRSKTEDIIQKTYYLSVQFYNYLQNQNISAKQFSFLKKSNVQQKEIELTLAAKNRELASEKERIKSLEEKLNYSSYETSEKLE